MPAYMSLDIVQSSRILSKKVSLFLNRIITRQLISCDDDEEKTPGGLIQKGIHHRRGNWYQNSALALYGISRWSSNFLWIFLAYILWRQAASTGRHTVRNPFRFSQSNDQDYLNHFYEGIYSDDSLNSTLGFQRIYILNLDRRTDRRDAMSLMVYKEGIEVQWVSAVDGQQIEPATFPLWNSTFTRGQMGCYRSHLNILRDMLENRIQTALILQDDVDWDIGLRYSLQRLQRPFKTLLQHLDVESDSQLDKFENSKIRKTSTPWNGGRGWDMLWLGAAYEQAHFNVRDEEDIKFLEAVQQQEERTGSSSVMTKFLSRPYLIYKDERVASKGLEEEGGKDVFPSYGLERWQEEGDPRLRIIQKTRNALGMAGTAYTIQGAAEILQELKFGMFASFDNAVSNRGFTVWPPLFSQRRNSEGHRDSDLLYDLRPIGVLQHVQDYSLEVMESRRV